MEGNKILSYFKTYRLKSGLTQKDLTYLLALNSASTISKTEKNIQEPTLGIVIAYCFIFDIEINDLLPTLSHDINKLIIKRAPLLAKDLKKQSQTPLVKQRISFLNSLYRSKKR